MLDLRTLTAQSVTIGDQKSHASAWVRVCVCLCARDGGISDRGALSNRQSIYISLMADEPMPTRWSFQVALFYSLNSAFLNAASTMATLCVLVILR